ncbi:MAG: YggT family protein [Chromatiales bacterium]|nr:YggT family protein [Chromatiales bacterium]
MQNAFLFIITAVFQLYALTFLLRLLLQWARVDARNPFCQFILRVTNPLVLPLRRYMPAVGPLDSATLVVLLALQMLFSFALVKMLCLADPGLLQLLALAVLRTARLLLQLWFFAILIFVILSWVSPGNYSPAAVLVEAIAAPLLAPLRRFIPPVGGLDLSPLVALIGLQALMMLLPAQQVVAPLLCRGGGQWLI